MTVEAAPTPASDVRRRGALRRLSGAIDDRANPILVKELRQASRGRYFTIVFWLTLTLATVAASLQLVEEARAASGDSGQRFFLLVLTFLVFTSCLFSPFAAFLSLSSEWDEGTHDMLVISGLSPWQIVRGKFLGAYVQALLYASAFLPFLAFAFLLRGLDLAGAAWVTGLVLVTSGGLTCVALALSTSAQKKFARLFVMALLAVFLTFVCTGALSMLGFTVLRQGLHRTPDGVAGMIAYASFVVLVSAFALASTAAKLAHPEENRSTVTRVLASVTLLVGLGWGAYFYGQAGSMEPLYVFGTLAAIWIGLQGFNFLAEEDRLGLRARLGVPRNARLAWLAAPWFPGGGRAVLFIVLHVAVTAVFLLFVPALRPPTSGSDPPHAAAVVSTTLSAYFFVYVGLPTGVLARWLGDPFWRMVARILALVLAFGTMFLPTIFGLLIGSYQLRELQHPGSPFYVVQEFIDGDGGVLVLLVLGVAAGVLVLNGPRALHGLAAMGAASRHRLAVEAELRREDAARAGAAGAPGADGDAPAR